MPSLWEGVYNKMNRGFRVYDRQENRMLNTPSADESIFLAGNGNLVDVDNPCVYLMNRFVRMDSTGLLDKQGKEIYEGDIVVLSSVLSDGDRKICKAVMDGWQSIFKSLENGFYCPMGSTAQNYREVIGNIWDNPELLVHKKIDN